MFIARCGKQNNDLSNSHAKIINVLNGIVLCRSLIDLFINMIVNTHSVSLNHDRIINKHNVSLLTLYSRYLAKTILWPSFYLRLPNVKFSPAQMLVANPPVHIDFCFLFLLLFTVDCWSPVELFIKLDTCRTLSSLHLLRES